MLTAATLWSHSHAVSSPLVPLPRVPLPRRELVRAGMDDRQLDRLIQQGRARTPYRGVVVDATADEDLRQRCRAALATQAEEAAIGHETAAALLTFPWLPKRWSSELSPVHVLVPRDDDRRHRSALRLHRAYLPASDVLVVDGVRCTNPARTLVDLARRQDARRLLVLQLADGALRRRLLGRGDLDGALRSAAGLRNVARARSWLRLARDGVDSPRETELRLILVDAGVPDVETDIRIHDDDGLLLARGDLGSRRLLLWAEYNGYDAHSRRDVFRGDRVGDRWLQRRGWHVMRFVDDDLRRPGRTVREWQAAAAEAPSRIAHLDPARSPEVAAARRLLGLD